MKKPNCGILGGYRRAVIRFNKSDWTLEAALKYVKKYEPQYSNKWKRVPEWDPNGEEYWLFESTEEFSYEATLEFGAK